MITYMNNIENYYDKNYFNLYQKKLESLEGKPIYSNSKNISPKKIMFWIFIQSISWAWIFSTYSHTLFYPWKTKNYHCHEK